MTEKLYSPSPFKDCGYVIRETGDGWRWVYIEPGEDYQYGPVKPTRAAALRSAADDWDETGGLVCNLSAVLRSVATREENARD